MGSRYYKSSNMLYVVTRVSWFEVAVIAAACWNWIIALRRPTFGVNNAGPQERLLEERRRSNQYITCNQFSEHSPLTGSEM